MSADVSVTGGDGTNCWDYTVDGVCQSSSRNYPMIYVPADDNWTSANIYPDSIYPEIYFAPSSVTWGNAPLNVNVRRGDYQIMHFNNPFSMVADMSFWIEFNALPAAANSSNMEVFLVNKSQDITLFQSDWRSSPSIELVGTFLNDATYHHQHSVNSGHLLVPITTNANGTVGLKNLDISGDFWIILYTQSPNVNRSWNLKYQPTSLCTNNNRWFKGNQSDWSTALQAGCPDAHIHIARQSLNEDAIKISLSALYNDLQTYTIIDTEYFGDIPNLPPTGSSFLTPEAGTYSGNLVINWDPSTDANGSPLTYTIDLLNGDTSFNKNLITATANTTFTLDTTTLPYGEYSLLGTVCDDGAPLMVTPLCTSFELNHTFIVNNASPIYSLSNISITSTGADNISKTGETITLSFSSSGLILNPIINFYSAGYEVINAVSINEPTTNNWIATFVVDSLDSTGEVTFDISEDYLDAQYFLTTDSSTMYIDNTAPLDPIADPISGTYVGAIAVAITSEGSSLIRFTTNESSPTCSTGELYAEIVPVLVSSTIKAIGCDAIGNYSQIVTFTYVIEEDPTPTDTPIPTDTPVPTDTLTPTPTDTPTVTASVTPTASPIVTPTNTPVPTTTITVVPTSKPSPTVKPTTTFIPTQTVIPEITILPTITPTITLIPTKINPTTKESPLLSITFLDEKYDTQITQKNGLKYFSEIKFKIVGSDLRALGNVNVTLRSNPVSGKTDENGMITFSNIPAGEHSVEVEYSGKTITKSFKIDEPDPEDEIIAMSVIQVTVETEPPQDNQPISSTSLLCGASLILTLIVGIVVLLRKSKKGEDEPRQI